MKSGNQNMKTITGGIYLVINPAMDQDQLLTKLEAALQAGIQAVQLWDNWPPDNNQANLITQIGQRCKSYHTPLLINNDWTMLPDHPLLNGVHFDDIPENLDLIQKQVGRQFIKGITCSDRLEPFLYATKHKFDYVSFCAMFPSPSAATCSLVMPETVRAARKISTIPLFVSGGITPENLRHLNKNTPFDGIAVISGIMTADDPGEMIRQYRIAASI